MKQWDQSTVDQKVQDRGKQFPLYPPREGNSITIEFLDDTFTIVDTGEEDLLGNTDEEWTNCQIRVADLNKDGRERVFSSRDFSQVLNEIAFLLKENKISPLKMKGTCIRIDGLPDYKYDIQIIDKADIKEEGATVIEDADEDQIRDAIISFEEDGLKGKELVNAVKAYLYAEGLTTTDSRVKELMKK